MDSNLKLYVWEKVFCDYSCGMCVVLAPSKKEALRIIEEKFRKEDTLYQLKELQDSEPTEHEDPICFCSHGGS